MGQGSATAKEGIYVCLEWDWDAQK